MLESFLFLFGPVALTALAGFLVRAGLREVRSYFWLPTIAGIALLAVICYWLYDIASYGQMALVGAVIIGFFCACTAMLFGVWMLWTLNTWRKVAALVLSVAFPILVFYSVQTGDSQSPESITQYNGDMIVQALNQHRAKVGRFPENLKDLAPEVLSSLPEALTTQRTGWLYESSGNDFVLGYWYWPEKFGASVCLFTLSNPEWECGFNNWGPFQVVSTPMP